MRRARVCVQGLPHHVTQRGNRRMNVFVDAEDRHLYLELLHEYSRRHRLDVWDYVLMSNHTHLIVVPRTPSALSATMRDTHGTYAAMFNRKYGFCGHLWQARFYSCPLDEEHLWHAVRYVERNPVRGGIVVRAVDYPWSGAGPHVLGERDRYLDAGLPLVEVIRDWSGWLAEDDQSETMLAIRTATATGRACGSDRFISEVESRLGRSLRPRKRGRKPTSRSGDEEETTRLPSGW
jgi:putative transposase